MLTAFRIAVLCLGATAFFGTVALSSEKSSYRQSTDSGDRSIVEEKRVGFDNPSGFGNIYVSRENICHHEKSNTLWTLGEISYCNARGRRADGMPNQGKCIEYLSEHLRTSVAYEKKACLKTRGQGKNKICTQYGKIKGQIPLSVNRKVYADHNSRMSRQGSATAKYSETLTFAPCPEAIVEN